MITLTYVRRDLEDQLFRKPENLLLDDDLNISEEGNELNFVWHKTLSSLYLVPFYTLSGILVVVS